MDLLYLEGNMQIWGDAEEFFRIVVMPVKRGSVCASLYFLN